MTEPLSAKAACAQLRDLLRECGTARSEGVEQRLSLYVDLLIKWNKRINLVGPATLADVWRRHILDSGQLMRWIPPETRTLADLGSGAGLPGLILAILGVPNVHLIESDARKCAFLQESARVTGSKVTIHNCRIEAAPKIGADIATARALAPVPALQILAKRILRPGGTCLFLKGQNWRYEIGSLQQIDIFERPSVTQSEAVILQISQPDKKT